MGTRQFRQLPVFIGSIHLLNICLLPFPEFPGGHSLHPVEETGEGGDFGEMEAVGDLGDAHRGLAQQERGLHQEHLVDVVDDGTAT